MNTSWVALLLLSSALSSVAFQQITPTVDEIGRRHAQALGGIEKIHALHSVVIRGIYHEPGEIPGDASTLQPDAYQAFMRPYYEFLTRSLRSRATPKTLDENNRRYFLFRRRSWRCHSVDGFTVTADRMSRARRMKKSGETHDDP